MLKFQKNKDKKKNLKIARGGKKNSIGTIIRSTLHKQQKPEANRMTELKG